MDLSHPWTEYDFVALDTETTGKYPLESELCEVAGVRWSKGKIVDTFQSLIKPSKPMGAEVIAIHGITNEMVENEPSAKEVIPKFRQFLGDAIVVAHHAPFDLGFLVRDFEKYQLPLSNTPAVCTALLSRQVIFGSENHRLQTLIKYLGLPPKQAHRALSDTEGCWDVALHCMKQLGEDKPLADVLQKQGGAIYWKAYSMQALRANAAYTAIIDAIEKNVDVQIVYQGGSLKGQPRTVKPIGLVRNPQGDFLVALDGSPPAKRFFLNKITASNL